MSTERSYFCNKCHFTHRRGRIFHAHLQFATEQVIWEILSPVKLHFTIKSRISKLTYIKIPKYALLHSSPNFPDDLGVYFKQKHVGSFLPYFLKKISVLKKDPKRPFYEYELGWFFRKDFKCSRIPHGAFLTFRHSRNFRKISVYWRRDLIGYIPDHEYNTILTYLDDNRYAIQGKFIKFVPQKYPSRTYAEIKIKVKDKNLVNDTIKKIIDLSRLGHPSPEDLALFFDQQSFKMLENAAESTGMKDLYRKIQQLMSVSIKTTKYDIIL